MQQIDLAVSPRAESDVTKQLRLEHFIPAVVYGHGFENLHIKMDYQTFRRVFEQATYSTIITLDVEGGDKVPVLVQEVQYHPVSDDIIHVDFHAIRMDEKVETNIHLDFVGESDAVKQGAILNTNKHEVHISCLPGDLVHAIEVDISALASVGDIIRIADVQAPEGITILDSPEEPVVSAIEPRVVQEEEPGAEAGEEGTEAGEGDGEGEKDADDSKEEKDEKGE